MKKLFVPTCAAALLAASLVPAFAAANPFEDVPADHWAYDAVAQLAADGVIEGYGDGSYRGDQEITRYEMAQMVARAMAKNPSGMDKAMVDKLAAEFADELNSLGVRVSNLEKKVDNVKWNGVVRARYADYRYLSDKGPLRTFVNYYTLRLEPSMQINEHWTGHVRIDYNGGIKSAQNVTGANQVTSGVKDNAPVTRPGLRVDRIWVQGDYNNFQILLGKLPYLTNIDGGMIYDDSLAGGQLTFGNKIKATLTAGRSRRFDGVGDVGPDRLDEAGKPGITGSYQAVEIYSDRANKWNWGVGFHHWANQAKLDDDIGATAISIWDIGLGYKFDKNLSLQGAFAWATGPQGEAATPAIPPGVDPKYPAGKPGEDASTIRTGAKRAWNVELDYKKANPTDAGSWGAFIAYRSLGQYAVIAPTYDAMIAGNRGVELGMSYVPFKNVMGTVKYFFGQTIGGESDETPLTSSSGFFGELNFFF